MKILDRYYVDCPACKETFTLHMSDFTAMFNQHQGFMYCPIHHCGAFLYATFEGNKMNLEIINPPKKETL